MKKSEDAELNDIFGDHEVYENSPPSPVKIKGTPAPSPNESLAEIMNPESPESPQSEPANLLIDETDVIKKFTVSKMEMKVALEKPEVRKCLTEKIYRHHRQNQHFKLYKKFIMRQNVYQWS